MGYIYLGNSGLYGRAIIMPVNMTPGWSQNRRENLTTLSPSLNFAMKASDLKHSQGPEFILVIWFYNKCVKRKVTPWKNEIFQYCNKHCVEVWHNIQTLKKWISEISKAYIKTLFYVLTLRVIFHLVFKSLKKIYIGSAISFFVVQS